MFFNNLEKKDKNFFQEICRIEIVVLYLQRILKPIEL